MVVPQPIDETGGISRRDILCSCGAAMFSTLLGGALASVKTARAEALSNSVPEIDRLAVTIVTDSYHLAISPNVRVGGVEVIRFGMPPAGKSLLQEFGLAMHLASTRGDENRNILLDFGFTPETLNNNIAMLGISTSALDALILSHGHYDHFGGLVGFLKQHQGKLRPGLPLYLGGEEAFCTREWTAGKIEDFGYLDRHALAGAGINVVYAPTASLIAEHGFTTGSIPTASFEKVLAPTRMTVGVKDGIGCYSDKLVADKQAAVVIPDDFQHELATCFNVKNRGLVVITSCSHRGVVNSVQRAVDVSGIKKVHAVMGGFHLAPQKSDYVRATVNALKEISPDVVIPMHCTGDAFIEVLQKEMPGKFIRSYSGSQFVFGT
jgi:7,8-dihydropterin-6-yl-methyl-4-(beta-D-ribofuranosyl)aminobenzene 5'-phosphate synthase